MAGTEGDGRRYSSRLNLIGGAFRFPKATVRSSGTFMRDTGWGQPSRKDPVAEERVIADLWCFLLAQRERSYVSIRLTYPWH